MDFRRLNLPRHPLILGLTILGFGFTVLGAAMPSHANTETASQTAATHYAAGDFAAAEAVHRARVEAAPGTPEAAYDLGHVLMAQGRWGDAVEVLESAIDRADDDARYLRLFGEALGRSARDASLFKQLGIAKRGLGYFEKAVKVDPADFDARTSLMEYYLQAPGIAGGGESKAIAQARETAAINATEGQRLFGRIHHEKKRWDEARAAFVNAIQADPDHVMARVGQARLAIDREDWNLAWRTLDSAFETASAANAPQDIGRIHVLFERGRLAALSNQRRDDGIDALQALLERPRPVDKSPIDAKTPTLPTVEALWFLGQLQAHVGATQDARNAYDRLLDLDPGHRGARRALSKLATVK